MRLVLVIALATLSCQVAPSPEPAQVQVPNRYWLSSPGDEAALTDVAARLHAAVGESLGRVLEPGFPRGCTVSSPPTTGAWMPECLQGSAPRDGLELSASGPLLRFMTLDFPSPRWFLFEVYLVPPASDGENLDLDALSELPRVAIAPFPMDEENYLQVLRAISEGIRAVGATPRDD